MFNPINKKIHYVYEGKILKMILKSNINQDLQRIFKENPTNLGKDPIVMVTPIDLEKAAFLAVSVCLSNKIHHQQLDCEKHFVLSIY